MRAVQILVVAAALGALAAPARADRLVGDCALRAAEPDKNYAVVLDAAGLDAAISQVPIQTLHPPVGFTDAFVECDRYSLIPAPNDYKVLEMGVVLHIRQTFANGETRGLFLEVVDGRIQVSFNQGKLERSEQDGMQAALDDLQRAFNGSATGTK